MADSPETRIRRKVAGETPQVRVTESGDIYITTATGKAVYVNGVSIPVGYKVYRALVSQTGLNNPTAVILENTLGGVPVWTRAGIGDYRLTLAGVFTANKTTAREGIAYLYASSFPRYFAGDRLSSNVYQVLTYSNAAGLAADDVLLNTLIEIFVYP